MGSGDPLVFDDDDDESEPLAWALERPVDDGSSTAELTDCFSIFPDPTMTCTPTEGTPSTTTNNTRKTDF